MLLHNPTDFLTKQKEKEYQDVISSLNDDKQKLEVKVKGNVNSKKIGKQKITYEVKNKLGIIKKKERIVNVVDKIPPTITLKGAKEIDVILGNKYTDLGYKMIDNVDGDISIKVKVKNNININKVGSYKIIYFGEDYLNLTLQKVDGLWKVTDANVDQFRI